MNVGGNFPAPLSPQLYALPGRVPFYVPEALLGITPHALSTEFESDPGWLWWDNGAAQTLRVPAGTPDWQNLLAPTTAAPRISFKQRKSCVTLQYPSQASGIYYCPTPLTFTPNQSTWITCDNQTIEQGIASSQVDIGLFKPIAGRAGTPDSIHLGTLDVGDGNGIRLLYGNFTANSFTLLSGSPTNNTIGAASWPYLALHIQSAGTISGCQVFAYAFDDNGHFTKIGNAAGLTVVGSTFYFGRYLRATAFAQPTANALQGNIFVGDFIRVSLQDQPPWIR